MKIEIHISDDKQTLSIAVDGGEPAKMENFILLTKEGEKTRNLVFGNMETVGRLLYGLYVNSWRFEETAMRDVLELVAEDIHDTRERRANVNGETIRRIN